MDNNKPAFIESLEQKYPGITLTRLEDKANRTALQQWSRPLSYTLDEQGQIISLNLKGAGLETIEIGAALKHLQKLNLNHNKLTKISFTVNLPELNLLDISYNEADIEKIDLKFPFEGLKELNIYKSRLGGIFFSESLFERFIDGTLYVNLGENNLDETLVNRMNLEDAAEREEALRKYFDIYKKENTTIHRLKLVFIGNTGVGKTTLYDILAGDDKAGPSTHGINIFDYSLPHPSKTDTSINVKGFDFGGQDYYHNTHLPFFSTNALYILLWGQGQEDMFTTTPRKREKDGKIRQEYIFPLRYWLGGIRYLLGDAGAADKKEFPSIKEIPAGADWEKEVNQRNFTGDTPSFKVHLLQNIPSEKGQEKDLNNADLRAAYPFIGKMAAWCLKEEEQATVAKNWLNAMLKEFPSAQTVPAINIKVAKELKERKEVIISLDALGKLDAVKKENYKDINAQMQDLAERLHDNLQGYFLPVEEKARPKAVLPQSEAAENKETETYKPLSEEQDALIRTNFVADIKTMTEWVYTILEEELTEDGYFTDKRAGEILKTKQPEAVSHKSYLLAFMLHQKIIFEVRNEADKVVYVAPNYLPDAIKPVERLFIDSFEPAIVQFELKGFFHTNIVAELLAGFLKNVPLAEEGTTWRYELWKNKVLLYDVANSEIKGDADKRMLYIEFDLQGKATTEDHKKQPDHEPVQKTTSKGKQPPSTHPHIRLRRFAKNYVKDDFLLKVAGYIESKLAGYDYVKWLYAPDGNYIPADCLEQQNEDSGKASPLIHHENKIYRKGDFNLFLNNSNQYPMKKLFISYSKDDLEYLKAFEKHLSILKRNSYISVWNDQALLPGEEWDIAIKKALNEADIVVFLVSASFLATDYINDVEIKNTLERQKQNKNAVTIVSVIIRPCLWEETPLAAFKAIPGKAAALSTSANADEFWTQTVLSLMKVLK
jgi:internalin A